MRKLQGDCLAEQVVRPFSRQAWSDAFNLPVSLTEFGSPALGATGSDPGRTADSTCLFKAIIASCPGATPDPTSFFARSRRFYSLSNASGGAFLSDCCLRLAVFLLRQLLRLSDGLSGDVLERRAIYFSHVIARNAFQLDEKLGNILMV